MTHRAAAACLLIALGLGACATDRDAAPPQREVPLEQGNNLALVQLRADDLRQGMTKADVYNLLGAPAQYGDGTWTYQGQGGSLVVRFDGDRYASHDAGDAKAKKR